MKSRSLSVWPFAILLVAGCGGRDGTGPPSLRYGEETCAHCRMIISDDRFAAALVDEDRGALKFDDVGCLVLHEAGRERPGASYWVRDHAGGGWLDARLATFVNGREVASPMGHDLAAMATPDRAADLTGGRDARRFRFGELTGYVQDEHLAKAGAAPRGSAH
ncbi:MAG: nitrous oxide reductase accessory protein NosL [Isosphaeraceae bacterium]